jgi:hypothetical protein
MCLAPAGPGVWPDEAVRELDDAPELDRSSLPVDTVDRKTPRPNDVTVVTARARNLPASTTSRRRGASKG